MNFESEWSDKETETYEELKPIQISEASHKEKTVQTNIENDIKPQQNSTEHEFNSDAFIVSCVILAFLAIKCATSSGWLVFTVLFLICLPIFIVIVKVLWSLFWTIYSKLFKSAYNIFKNS